MCVAIGYKLLASAFVVIVYKFLLLLLLKCSDLELAPPLPTGAAVAKPKCCQHAIAPWGGTLGDRLTAHRAVLYLATAHGAALHSAIALGAAHHSAIAHVAAHHSAIALVAAHTSAIALVAAPNSAIALGAALHSAMPSRRLE